MCVSVCVKTGLNACWLFGSLLSDFPNRIPVWWYLTNLFLYGLNFITNDVDLPNVNVLLVIFSNVENFVFHFLLLQMFTLKVHVVFQSARQIIYIEFDITSSHKKKSTGNYFLSFVLRV